MNIKGGSLDEPLDLAGAVHLWATSMLSGVVIPPGAVVFLHEPDDEP